MNCVDEIMQKYTDRPIILDHILIQLVKAKSAVWQRFIGAAVN